MIVFDLACPHGHVFEAWFGSTEDYESQRTRGLLSCPICNSFVVEKAVMAPRVSRKSNQIENAASPPPPSARPSSEAVPGPEQMKAMLETLAVAQREALKGSTWVGRNFADEARAIHLGESAAHSIHGQATPDEARALIEEGVPVAPLPFPVRPPEADN